MKNNTAESTDIRHARKKQKRKRRIIRITGLIAFAGICVCVYLTRAMWLPKLEGILDRNKGLIVNDGKLEAGNFPLEVTDSGKAGLVTLEDYFVMVDDSDIKLFNVNGELENSIPHTLAHPAAAVSGKRMLIYENGGNSFEVINKKGEIFKKTIDDLILLADMKSGKTAIVTQTDKYDAYLTVYDETGNVIYKWAANKRISAVSVNEDGDGCCLAVFTSEAGVMKSEIHELDFSSQEDKMVSVPLDSLIIAAEKNKANDIWAVGDSKLFRIDDNGTVASSYEYNGELCAYDISGKLCAVALKGNVRKTSELLIFSSDDNDITGDERITSGVIKSLVIDDDNVFMLSEQSAECFDDHAELIATAAVSNEYVDFVYLDDSLVFLGYREINKIKFQT